MLLLLRRLQWMQWRSAHSTKYCYNLHAHEQPTSYPVHILRMNKKQKEAMDISGTMGEDGRQWNILMTEICNFCASLNIAGANSAAGLPHGKGRLRRDEVWVGDVSDPSTVIVRVKQKTKALWSSETSWTTRPTTRRHVTQHTRMSAAEIQLTENAKWEKYFQSYVGCSCGGVHSTDSWTGLLWIREWTSGFHKKHRTDYWTSRTRCARGHLVRNMKWTRKFQFDTTF